MKFAAVVCGPGVRPLSFHLLPFLTLSALAAIAFPNPALADGSDSPCASDEKCAGYDRPGADVDAGSGSSCAPDEECDEPRPDRPAVDGGVAPEAPQSPDGGPAWSGDLPEDLDGIDLPDELDGMDPDIIERTLKGHDTYEENGHTCGAESFLQCDISFCVKPDRTSCYYVANGAQVTCDDCSEEAVKSCGFAAARECIDLVEMLGCSAPGTGANTNAGWMALTLAGLFIRSKRARRSARARR